MLPTVVCDTSMAERQLRGKISPVADVRAHKQLLKKLGGETFPY
jgi:hypothetical protein